MDVAALIEWLDRGRRDCWDGRTAGAGYEGGRRWICRGDWLRRRERIVMEMRFQRALMVPAGQSR